MVNFNGKIVDDIYCISPKNRGYAYGDALFETIKSVNGKLLFWEDHYFRLMASMRIMRMEIPMNFTMEFLEMQIQKALEAHQLSNRFARVKLQVHRVEGGLYLPKNHTVEFIILAESLESGAYLFKDGYYEIDLFKDYDISPSLLSTLKTNNKAINVVGSIFAQENNLNNCLVLNTNKHVVEALNGNVFLVIGNLIKTPPITEGCLKGIMRKQIMDLVKNSQEYQLEEASISAFELQKADEIFITNVITGIQPVTKYRKKEFKFEVSKNLIQKLNDKLGYA
ncbi:aminotransferase class IV [Aestuariivivens sediminis]|uniref:aminotransferase class IV n=1 Tax=Aestuariivivens sediminis TaxID=2913557 RepID=UPI001F56B9AF|nr:aminotransferase class IV [Aestuariivivens sediminis]